MEKFMKKILLSTLAALALTAGFGADDAAAGDRGHHGGHHYDRGHDRGHHYGHRNKPRFYGHYRAPVYCRPAPPHYYPRPVYYQPAPVYYEPYYPANYVSFGFNFR